MGMRLMAGLAAALVLSSFAFAAPKAGDLAEIGKRGKQIYLLDQAAWVATDAALAQMPDADSAGVGGWIVVERPEGYRVIFYRHGPAPTSVFTADVRDGQVAAAHRLTDSEDASLTAQEVRMVRAREAAGKQDVQPCTAGAMNTVVIPPASPDAPVEVYVMSAQVKAGEIPFGGHYRYDIDAGGQVLASRQFTNGCVNLSTTPPETGAQTVGLMLTHFLDASPTEIHVFGSLSAHEPVYVATPKVLGEPTDEPAIWEVDGSSIRLVRP